MTDDLEKLINKALLHWTAREISLHFHGRKKGGVVRIARAYSVTAAFKLASSKAAPKARSRWRS